MTNYFDLPNIVRQEYTQGRVVSHGNFEYACFYKFVSEESIELYSEETAYNFPMYTHYKSLVV